MKKIVKLTESDLTRIVKRVIKEQSGPTMKELKEMESKVYVLMVPFYDEYGMENTIQLLQDVAGLFENESDDMNDMSNNDLTSDEINLLNSYIDDEDEEY
jgi:hypothetical protein